MGILLAPDHYSIVTPGNLVNLFPHGRPLPTGQLVIPHEPIETRILRNLGFSVPSPILNSYDWRETVPFEAQKITAAMLVVEPRAFVLSTMGTGKTRAVLFAYDWLRQRKLVKKMLVVAPLSTLNFVWVREVMMTMPSYKVGVVYGSRERRERILQGDFDIYIINHDGVGTVAGLIASLPEFDVLCLDEAAVYRRATNKKWKQMNKLTGRFKYVWGLTGTPTPRDPTDAYGIIKLINPSAFPHSFTRFRDELMFKVTTFKWVPRKGAEKKVFDLMQPAVRYTMDDCQDMPPMTFTDHEVILTAKQHKAYEILRKHCHMLWESKEITAVNGGVLLNKLLQVSTGCIYDNNHNPIMIDATNRLNTTLELVQTNDRKSLIFVPFIPVIKLVADFLRDRGCLVHEVSGATPKHDRDIIFQTFQTAPVISGKPEVIVAHPKTMAHGLTLTEANMVLWYAPINDLEIYEQANARVFRPGQTAKHVTVRHLAGSRVEQLAYKRLSQRQQVQDALLDLFEEDP